MKISKELVEKILASLDEHPSNYLTVSNLAKEVGEVESENSSSLTDAFVNHLLHLQDLGCFVNLKGDNSFGYSAREDSSKPEGFSHTYNDVHIRLTAKGRELLDLLRNDSITEKSKNTALRIGGELVTALLVKAVTGV